MSMVARGNYIYSLNYISGSVVILEVTDISNPSAPITIASAPLISAICGGKLDIEGAYVYADTFCSPGFGGGSINVFDISNPKTPDYCRLVPMTHSVIQALLPFKANTHMRAVPLCIYRTYPTPTLLLRCTLLCQQE